MIKCDRRHLEQRCLQRGYSLEEVMGCVVSRDGDLWVVDTDHRDYPSAKAGILSFQCLPDCNSSEFACQPGFCCVENFSTGGNDCLPCPSSSSSSVGSSSSSADLCAQCQGECGQLPGYDESYVTALCAAIAESPSLAPCKEGEPTCLGVVAPDTEEGAWLVKYCCGPSSSSSEGSSSSESNSSSSSVVSSSSSESTSSSSSSSSPASSSSSGDTYCCISSGGFEGPWYDPWPIPIMCGDPPVPDQGCLDGGGSFEDCCKQAGCDGGGGPLPFCWKYTDACGFCESDQSGGGNKCITASSPAEASSICDQWRMG